LAWTKAGQEIIEFTDEILNIKITYLTLQNFLELWRVKLFKDYIFEAPFPIVDPGKTVVWTYTRKGEQNFSVVSKCIENYLCV
jgi:hypothetical protein